MLALDQRDSPTCLGERSGQRPTRLTRTDYHCIESFAHLQQVSLLELSQS